MIGLHRTACFQTHLPRPHLHIFPTRGQAAAPTSRLHRHVARQSRRLQTCRAATELEQPIAEGNAPLEWLVKECNASPTSLKIERRFFGEGLGYGVVATADVAPGEVLLSVPLTNAITSAQGAKGSNKWSIEMAEELLAHASQGPNSPLAPWVAALPAHVPLPWLHYTQQELEALQDPHTLSECEHFAEMYQQACQQLSTHSAERVAWALSIIHSRSFIASGSHVFVPGIDFCNHSLAPSAGVRIWHPLSQGAEAEAEVCEPQPPEPSRFELVAGEGGIRAGGEVSISYGKWPNDVFLLFFGFVPSEDPQPQAGAPSTDTAVIFQGLSELALRYHAHVLSWWLERGLVAEGQLGSLGDLRSPELRQRVVRLWREALRSGALAAGQDYSRMFVTSSGFDGRLVQAANALVQLYPAHFSPVGAQPSAEQQRSSANSSTSGDGSSSSSGGSSGGGSSSGGSSEGSSRRQPLPQPPLQEFLRQVCEEVLAAFPTSWEQDAAWLAREEGAAASENMLTAIRYRMSKKATLRAAVAQLSPVASS